MVIFATLHACFMCHFESHTIFGQLCSDFASLRGLFYALVWSICVSFWLFYISFCKFCGLNSVIPPIYVTIYVSMQLFACNFVPFPLHTCCFGCFSSWLVIFFVSFASHFGICIIYGFLSILFNLEVLVKRHFLQGRHHSTKMTLIEYSFVVLH